MQAGPMRLGRLFLQLLPLVSNKHPISLRADAGREREGMWADAGRDRDHAGLPGDVDCRSLGFLPACRAQAQALLLIIRLLDALFLVSAARPTHSAHGAVEGLKMRCGFVAAPRAERWRA